MNINNWFVLTLGETLEYPHNSRLCFFGIWPYQHLIHSLLISFKISKNQGDKWWWIPQNQVSWKQLMKKLYLLLCISHETFNIIATRFLNSYIRIFPHARVKSDEEPFEFFGYFPWLWIQQFSFIPGHHADFVSVFAYRWISIIVLSQYMVRQSNIHITIDFVSLEFDPNSSLYILYQFF